MGYFDSFRGYFYKMLFFEDMPELNIHLCESKSSATHSHDFLELAYVVKGQAMHRLNDEERIISQGDYFIIDYDSAHSYKTIDDRELLIINCLFKPEFIDTSLMKCRNFSEVVNNYMVKHNASTINISPANYIFRDDEDEIYKLISGMLEEFEKKPTGYYEMIRSKLIEIIILTMRKNTPPKEVSDQVCEYMLEYSQRNISEKNILANISKQLNFSSSYLSRKFKDNMGITFSAYMQKKRIEYSCRMLAATKKTITEIAQLAGYSDIKFFNSVFKKNMGMTPREFRRNI